MRGFFHKAVLFRRKAAALLLVLGSVALLALLVVALLTLSRTDQKSSRAFEESISVRSMAEIPVNVVMGQIRSATTDLGNEKTWASQPGMIRVFGNEQRASDFRSDTDRVYRLYSHNTLVSMGTDFDPALEVPPGDWATQSGLFTDLNEPVVQVAVGTGEPRPVYPILDAGELYEVEGFELSAVPGGTTLQPAPMPVRWLYVLEDGRMLAPIEQNGDEVRFGGDGPTAENPITGRIAFWTDDESAKLNVNTASEGIPWDTPRGNSATDAESYADRQPVRNEFQRYPGHPASVSLGPVFSKLFTYDPYATLSGTNNPAAFMNLVPRVAVRGSNGNYSLDKVTAATPEIVLDNDRLFASVDELYFGTGFDPSTGRRRETRPVPGQDFNESSPLVTRPFLDKANFFLSGHSRSPEVNLFNKPRISLWPLQADAANDRNVLDRLLAFCSTTGRQPYYFQRQSVCELSSTGSYGSSQSSVADWANVTRNQTLLGYLKLLTSKKIPGFGGKFGGDNDSKYPLDRDQILVQMMDYIRAGVNVHAISTSGKLPTGRNSSGYSYVPPRQVPGVGAKRGEGAVVPLRIQLEGVETMGFGRNVTVTEATLVIYPTKYQGPTVFPSSETPSTFPFTPEGLAALRGYPATSVRAYLMLEFFSPSVGLPTWSPYLNVKVEGLDNFKLNGSSLNMPNSGTVLLHTPAGFIPDSGHHVGSGHISAFPTNFMQFFHGDAWPGQRRNVMSMDATSGFAWHSQSDVNVTAGVPNLLQGAPLSITISNYTNTEVIQKISLTFPSSAAVPPVFAWAKEAGVDAAGNPQYQVEPDETSLQQRLARSPADYGGYLIRPGDICRSVEAGNAGENPNNITATVDGSSIRSQTKTFAPPMGDFRLYACTPQVPASWFVPGGKWDKSIGDVEYFNPAVRFVTGFRVGNFWQYWGHMCTRLQPYDGYEVINGNRGDNPFHKESSFLTAGALVPDLYYDNDTRWRSDIRPYRDAAQVCARGLQAARRIDGRLGDWDNGIGNLEDGCYINKPDDTNASFEARAGWDWWVTNGAYGGYYSRGSFNIDQNSVNHAPNRQIASAMSMGSLPTGVKSVQPWQTLLFCPNPIGRATASTARPTTNDHFGFASNGKPHDHLLADFFWMPSVEPYSISEPFSTAGKVNMNYDIMPFRYIKRRTALVSLLQGTVVAAMKPEVNRRPRGTCMKGGRDQAYDQEIRYDVNTSAITGTLKGFEQRFNQERDLFRSATEVSELFLVPKKRTRGGFYPAAPVPNYPGDAEPTYDNVAAWWTNYRGTGDNSREMPYRDLHARLTTKSNTFTIHYRVQLLKKARSTGAMVWDETRDATLSEYRGSTTLERYVDPNTAAVPDYASGNDSLKPLDDFYQFRIIKKRQFAP